MTQTPTTTEELKHLASSENDNELTRRLARECLASREAKPVGFDVLADAVKEVTGGIRMEFTPGTYKGHQSVPFMNFTSLSRIVEMFRTTPPAPALQKDVEAVVGLLESGEWAEHCTRSELGQRLESAVTALVGSERLAPAVPDKARVGEMPFLGSSEPVYVRGWNDCRAAMLAQPVSHGCKWTYDEHDYKWDSGCGEAWMFSDGGPIENSVKFCQSCGKPVLLAAAPEGGNDA